MMENVCVVGLGYIGLPTASLLATKGFKVHGVDVNPKAVETINRGEIHIYEPDLDILVRAAVQSGQLKAALEPASAEVFILAVPTPFMEGKVPDLSYVEAATKAIAPYVMPGNLVILESTSPVGTTEKVADWLFEMRPELNIPRWSTKGGVVGGGKDQVFVAHCPERVLPGQILKELVGNDRIVGGIDDTSMHKAEAFYQKFVSGEILTTNARTAEMSKLCENAFRDVNIAFANELSTICDRLSINVWDLVELANRHPRVNILQPGPGVGGHCIAVDPWFIVHSAPEEARLIRTAREVNDGKPHWVIDRVKAKADRFKQPRIACLGLAFKADIDDLRESPSMEIVELLAKEKVGELLVVEPHIEELPKRLAGIENVRFVELGDALRDADILLLLVDHKTFRRVDRDLLKEKVVIDTRGIWHDKRH